MERCELYTNSIGCDSLVVKSTDGKQASFLQPLQNFLQKLHRDYFEASLLGLCEKVKWVQNKGIREWNKQSFH